MDKKPEIFPPPGRRHFLKRVLLTVPLISTVFASRAADSSYGIRGQMAPDIFATDWIDAHGDPTEFDMREIREKWVYLKCFQSWCPGCHRYGLPALQKFSRAFANEPRVVALAVQTVFEGFSVNTPDKVSAIQRQYDLAIKMGHDAGMSVDSQRSLTMRRFRTGGTPWVVIIDPTGRVVFNDYHVDVEKLITFIRQNLVSQSASNTTARQINPAIIPLLSRR